MSAIDWTIVAAVLGISVVLGLWFTRRAGTSTEEYFLSGRNLPWWLLGTSMVATTFSADTPLAVTEYVRSAGIWKNWWWWSLMMTHVLATVAFSRLWRRARVLTDNELLELRYAGRAAAALRAFKAGYFALVVNVIVMGWVLNAMATIVTASLGIPFWVSVVVSSAAALLYTVSAGLWGVMITDLFQFGVAIIGAVAVAVYATDAAGGLEALRAATDVGDRLALVPTSDEALPAFLVFICVQWWATHSADGGGYFIQRMSAARSERDARAGTLWFCIAHYGLRTWPWIVAALATVVLVPAGSVSDKAAYPELAMRVLPEGWRGVMVASLLAAFMSTIVTHLNWGASYVVHDLYRRFWRKDRDERHYVTTARVASVVMMALGCVAAYGVDSISGAWTLVWSMGAGLGPVLILRWFWWRINAWSEIAALGTSAALAIPLAAISMPEWQRALVIVPASLALTLLVTFLTKPVPRERLVAFYERVRPGGFWGDIAAQVGRGGTLGGSVFVDWLLGLALVLGMTLGPGELMFGSKSYAAAYCAVAVLGGVALALRWRRSRRDG